MVREPEGRLIYLWAGHQCCHSLPAIRYQLYIHAFGRRQGYPIMKFWLHNHYYPSPTMTTTSEKPRTNLKHKLLLSDQTRPSSKRWRSGRFHTYQVP